MNIQHITLYKHVHPCQRLSLDEAKVKKSPIIARACFDFQDTVLESISFVFGIRNRTVDPRGRSRSTLCVSVLSG